MNHCSKFLSVNLHFYGEGTNETLQSVEGHSHLTYSATEFGTGKCITAVKQK